MAFMHDDGRELILHWAAQGRLKGSDLPRALTLAGLLPGPTDWRRFIDRLLLWLGVVLVSAALVFFLAFNWNELGRFAKFGMAQAALLVALLFVWRTGLDRPSGQAALLGGGILIGALLALIGQTYQTGADTFELFAAWAALLLPWALLARFAPLWLFWLALVNLAADLYFHTMFAGFGSFSGGLNRLWLSFAISTSALVVWQVLAWRGVAWLQVRWAIRLLALVAGLDATWLGAAQVVDRDGNVSFGLIAWAAWLVAAYFVYRRRQLDLFVLAGGVLSVIVVATSFMARQMSWSHPGGFLFIGVAVIAMSGAGAWWLKQLAAEEAAK